MKVSLNWLREMVDLPPTVDELTELLTLAGVEVEGVQTLGVNIPKVVVAQILESTQHPNADRLSVCRVDDGSGHPRQIVCGAKNYRVGDKVPLALPGAVLPGDFKIKVGKLRGVESEGMLCSSTELGLPKGEDGLLILPQSATPGASLEELFPSETVLDLEITPNRADLLSHYGIAREVAALTGNALRQPPEGAEVEASGTVAISTPVCREYTVLRIDNVQVGPSPAWLQRKLEAVGLRAINNIVDVTNFVMFELGQPLHAFDADKVQGAIQVRSANAEESFAALDGKTYVLKAGQAVIADDQNALALAGVMGGEASGVTAGTKNILLESAWFDPSSVRRTSRETELSSDSSYRFERGVNRAGVERASARAAAIILEIAGGEVIDFKQGGDGAVQQDVVVSLRAERVKSLLGVEVAPGRIAEILTGFGLAAVDGGWKIPSHRADLTREVDLIEEIARVVGIDSIPCRLSGAPAEPADADLAYDFEMSIRQKLVGSGLNEARTSTLISEALCGDTANALRLKNPLGEDQAFLRPSLVPGLLGAIAFNLRQGATTVGLYEVGRTFHAQAPEERATLAIASSGAAHPANWRGGAGRSLDWHDAKAIVESLLPGSVTWTTVEAKAPVGLAAEVSVNGTRVGWLGQIAPGAAKALDATSAILVAEIDLDVLRGLQGARAYQEISRFPAVVRDIAVVAPSALAYGEIEGVLRGAGEELLTGVKPFDIFSDASGEKLPVGQKSVAISLTFQAPGRTLNGEEVNAASERLKQLLKSKLSVNFRE